MLIGVDWVGHLVLVAVRLRYYKACNSAPTIQEDVQQIRLPRLRFSKTFIPWLLEMKEVTTG
jgi:hypothetical protein